MTKQKKFGHLQLERIRDLAIAKLRAKQKEELRLMSIQWHKQEKELTAAILSMGTTPYFKWPEWLKAAVHQWEGEMHGVAKVFGTTFKSPVNKKKGISTGRSISK